VSIFHEGRATLLHSTLFFYMQVVGCGGQWRVWRPVLTQSWKIITAVQSRNQLQRTSARRLLVLPRMYLMLPLSKLNIRCFCWISGLVWL